MVNNGRAALTGIQERGQALVVDLPQVPWQDSGCSTHALEHGAAQSRIDFLAAVDGEAAQSLCACPLASAMMQLHLSSSSSTIPGTRVIPTAPATWTTRVYDLQGDESCLKSIPTRLLNGLPVGYELSSGSHLSPLYVKNLKFRKERGRELEEMK